MEFVSRSALAFKLYTSVTLPAIFLFVCLTVSLVWFKFGLFVWLVVFRKLRHFYFYFFWTSMLCTPATVTQVNLFSLLVPQNGSVATSNCLQDIYKKNLPWKPASWLVCIFSLAFSVVKCKQLSIASKAYPSISHLISHQSRMCHLTHIFSMFRSIVWFLPQFLLRNKALILISKNINHK